MVIDFTFFKCKAIEIQFYKFSNRSDNNVGICVNHWNSHTIATDIFRNNCIILIKRHWPQILFRDKVIIPQ